MQASRMKEVQGSRAEGQRPRAKVQDPRVRHSAFRIPHSAFPTAGFTLLEILVASTILSMVLAILYGVFSRTLTSKQLAEEQSAQSRAARIVLLRIGDDLQPASRSPQKTPALSAKPIKPNIF